VTYNGFLISFRVGLRVNSAESYFSQQRLSLPTEGVDPAIAFSKFNF